MRKEEEQLFPLAERLLGARELETLSRTLERTRQKAPSIGFQTQVS
jgi:hypothetical protein